MTAQRARLPDGRWHFQHGPIDLVIGADGDATAVELAHVAAWARFEPVLGELVAELPTLRLPIRGPCPLRGVIARRMWGACRPFHDVYITPMAAVAGAVAQEIVACYARPGVRRAWVNNGGDIALHLTEGASWRVGVVTDISSPFALSPSTMLRTGLSKGASTSSARTGGAGVGADAHFEVDAALPVRGIATSGWRGRSFSLGIADSVTVLARTAAMADAAATIIANAVDVDDARIVRAPADSLKDDTDLGDLPVTVDVPPLVPALVRRALLAGEQRARALQRDGLIHAALLVCQDGWSRVEASARLPELGSVFA